MSVMTDITDMIDLAVFESNVTDCFDTHLSIGDVVVEAVMTRNGVNCPKMSDSPETYTIYAFGMNILGCHNVDGPFQYDFEIPVLTGLDRIEEFVLVRSLATDKYIVRHMSELCWVSEL